MAQPEMRFFVPDTPRYTAGTGPWGTVKASFPRGAAAFLSG